MEKSAVNILIRKCAIVIGISIAVFALMQVLFNGAHCLDCGARVGFPFSYMQEGTFATLGRFIWIGFLGDCAVAFSISMLAVWLWRKLWRKRKDSRKVLIDRS